MFKHNFLCLFIVCLFVACGTPQKQETAIDTAGLRTVRIDKHTPSLPFDSIVGRAWYIKLETDKQSLIGQPMQLLFTDSLVIVIDKLYAPRAVGFGLDGSYRCTYGIFGKGPGEYSELGWAALTPDREQLVIADYAAARYHYYRLDGTFDHSCDLFWRGCSFEFLTPDTLATSNFGNVYLNGKGEQDGTLVLSDLKSESGAQLFPYLFTQGMMPVNPTGGIRKYNDTVYYIPSLADTVYRVSPTALEAVYAIDIEGTKRPGYDATVQEYMDFMSKTPYFNGNFVETDSYAAFGLAPYSPYPVLYDKATGKSYRIEAPKQEGLCSFFRDGYVLSGTGTNTLVAEMSAAEILDKAGSMEKPLPPEVEALIDGLEENDNPVIFLYDIVLPE